MNNLRLAIFVGYGLLAILGVLMLTSIAPDRVSQQTLLLFLGALLMFYLSRQDIMVFRQFGTSIYVTTLLLLISTFIFGSVVRGAVRWIDIMGFRLQTSEIAKPLLVLSFAYFLERFPPKNIKNILLNVAIYLLPVLLIFRQPDLGTALVVSAIWGGMIFVAGIPYWLVGVGGLGLGLAAYLSPRFLQPYQLDRLRTFFDPYQDPLGSGYNVIQAIIAVGSGQILGKGLGHGTQSHFRFLPERHTDFMFASLAEELGLVGAGAVIIILGVMLYYLLSTLLKPLPRYHSLVLTGVFSYLLFQSAINIGMNIGIAPVTGVTLPLISYGGSSVLATALMFGLALSASSKVTRTSVLEIK